MINNFFTTFVPFNLVNSLNTLAIYSPTRGPPRVAPTAPRLMTPLFVTINFHCPNFSSDKLTPKFVTKIVVDKLPPKCNQTQLDAETFVIEKFSLKYSDNRFITEFKIFITEIFVDKRWVFHQ